MVVDPSFRASDATLRMTKSWRGFASKDVRKKTTRGTPRNSRHVTSAKGLMPEGQKFDRQLHGSVLARLHEISSFIAESKEYKAYCSNQKHGKQTCYTGMERKSLFKGKQPGLPRFTCISCIKTAFAQMNNRLDKYPNSQIVGCCRFVISGKD